MKKKNIKMNTKNHRNRKLTNKNKTKKKRKKKSLKKLKGGECNRKEKGKHVECLAITGHGKKVHHRSSDPPPVFTIPDNIVLTFYSKEGCVGTAWINEARDICYENPAIMELKQESYTANQNCPNYWIKTFVDPYPVYLSRAGGIYLCPKPYQNSFNEESKKRYGYNLIDKPNYHQRPDIMSNLLVELTSDNYYHKEKGTPLSYLVNFISELIVKNNTENEKKIDKVYINCNFCRGGTDSKQLASFFKELEDINGDHLNSSEAFNKNLMEFFDKNVYGEEQANWPETNTFGELNIETIKKNFHK